MRTRTVFGLVTVAGCCAAATPAQGATLFGSDLATAPAAVHAGGTQYVNLTQRMSDATSVTAPSSGVLVRLRLRRGATAGSPGTYAFRILSGVPLSLTARPATFDGADRKYPIPPNSAAGIDTITPIDGDGRPRGVPIAAGEYLALWTSGGLMAGLSAGDGAIGSLGLDHFSGSQNYASLPATQALQGVIEPDADGDQYGDESQDPCPAVAGVVCDPPVKIVDRPVPQIVTVPGPTVVRTIACGTGTKPNAAKTACVKTKCATGRRLSGNTCKKIKCKKGTRLKGNKCVKRKAAKKRAVRS